MTELAPLSPVDEIKKALLTLPQFQPDIAHIFHAGMYARIVSRPAGVLVVGLQHKKDHLYLVLSGTVSITSDDGPAEVVHAPRLFQSVPGARRAVYALTDCITMTLHRTDCTDVESVCEESVHPDPDSAYDSFGLVKTERLES